MNNSDTTLCRQTKLQESIVMKAEKLFGVKYGTNATCMTELLEHFKAAKTGKYEAKAKHKTDFTIKMGVLFGIDPKKMENALEQHNPFKAPIFDFTEVESFVNRQDVIHYYITSPVLAMCQKIRIKEPYDLEWLHKIEEGIKQLNFGNQFIRYQKTGSRIVGLSVKHFGIREGLPDIKYAFFNMDVVERKLSTAEPLYDYGNDPLDTSQALDFDAASKKLFIQLVTFMELAEIQTVFLQPGRKHGTKKKPDNLLNDAKFPITIVNTNWNKIIRTTGFDVEGHLRKQPCGPKNSERKLIWIDRHHRKGYNLKAGKMRNDPSGGHKL